MAGLLGGPVGRRPVGVVLLGEGVLQSLVNGCLHRCAEDDVDTVRGGPPQPALGEPDVTLTEVRSGEVGELHGAQGREDVVAAE